MTKCKLPEETTVRERLNREGEADNAFPSEEKLYRAFKRGGDSREDIWSDKFQYYDSLSVNREKYSELYDVLFTEAVPIEERDKWGISWITKEQAVRLFVQTDDSLSSTTEYNIDHAIYSKKIRIEDQDKLEVSRWEFEIVHKPIFSDDFGKSNFAHAEINLLKDGQFRPSGKQETQYHKTCCSLRPSGISERSGYLRSRSASIVVWQQKCSNSDSGAKTLKPPISFWILRDCGPKRNHTGYRGRQKRWATR
jgi:hypothetical protein